MMLILDIHDLSGKHVVKVGVDVRDLEGMLLAAGIADVLDQAGYQVRGAAMDETGKPVTKDELGEWVMTAPSVTYDEPDKMLDLPVPPKKGEMYVWDGEGNQHIWPGSPN